MRFSLFKKKPFELLNLERDIKHMQAYSEKGQILLAIECLQRALIQAEMYYGPDHHETLKCKEIMGDLLFRDRDYDQALASYTHVLEFYGYGSFDHDRLRTKEQKTIDMINNTRNNKAKTLKNRTHSDYESAKKLFREKNFPKAKMSVLRALGSCKMLYGINHRLVMPMRELLGDIFNEMEEYEQAHDVFSGLKFTMEREYGTDHMEYMRIAKKLEDIPCAFMHTGSSKIIDDVMSFRSMARSDSEDDIDVLEKDDTAFIALIELRTQLGINHYDRGNIDSAQEYFENVLEALVDLYDDQNIQVARVKSHLGDCALRLDDIPAALEYYDAAVIIASEVLGEKSDFCKELELKISEVRGNRDASTKSQVPDKAEELRILYHDKRSSNEDSSIDLHDSLDVITNGSHICTKEKKKINPDISISNESSSHSHEKYYLNSSTHSQSSQRKYSRHNTYPEPENTHPMKQEMTRANSDCLAGLIDNAHDGQKFNVCSDFFKELEDITRS